MALVEPGPFPSNLLAAGRPPARADVLTSYGDLGQVPATIIAGFAQMLASDQAPDPQLVVDTYLSLADAAPGNFVLTVSEGQWNGTTNAFYDLFRMEDGMIVEHWDVIQPVPTEGLANTNGMFTGFDN